MPWLPEAVASVAAQRANVDVEHIVLDGGSTDGSAEWLRAYAGPEIVARFEPDGGQTDALINGFELATGELLGWLNADDVLETDALSIAHQAFANNPDAAIVGGAALFIDGSGAVVGAMPTP